MSASTPPTPSVTTTDPDVPPSSCLAANIIIGIVLLIRRHSIGIDPATVTTASTRS